MTNPPDGADGPPDRILLVDDDEGIRLAFQRVARQGGFIADTAPDGPTAVALCGQHRYGVIALDYAMPVMTGFDVHDELLLVAPDATFGLISAQCDLELAMAATNDHGFSFLLTKPWHTTELVSVLRRAMEEHWERAAYRKLEEQAAGRQAPVSAGKVVDLVAKVLEDKRPNAVRRGFRRRALAHVVCSALGLPLQTIADACAAAFVRGSLLPGERPATTEAARGAESDDTSLLALLGQVAAHSAVSSLLSALESGVTKSERTQPQGSIAARVVRAVEVFDEALEEVAWGPQQGVVHAITKVLAAPALDTPVVQALVCADRNALISIAEKYRPCLVQPFARSA